MSDKEGRCPYSDDNFSTKDRPHRLIFGPKRTGRHLRLSGDRIDEELRTARSSTDVIILQI